ncbi:carboxypeptidase-like regulatory domain-containing protein [Flavivirga spongiicola]|uniref:Carboxypeptidase-like regulatory domain-containing protein n=1 Tax=Flavivirga spongiicola TaxID=421621 RepID=A0ABU7XS46_9FLAO|nr:carboxypeptidase-like regulatory domain-containing protein [Flavivirga sp. MEBiC05379]MDO5978346.1 carboxypeptidase-like regulatory domain-containing protein [Flavivirga sp. MEBiC05379]
MLLKSSLIYILFTVFLFSLQAQNVDYTLRGRILDQLQTPLESATIICGNKSIGATTDKNGFFNLSLRGTPEDVLSISFLGYKKKEINIQNFLSLPNHIIYLEQDIITLGEIIIGNKNLDDEISPRDFFKKIHKSFNNSLPNYNYVSKAYYKEKVKYNDKYVLFAQGLGYAINMGNLHNASYLSRYKFFYKNTKLANIDSLWKESVKKKYNLEHGSWLNGSANLNQYLRLIKYGVLSKNWKKYNFELDSIYYKNHQKVYRVSFKGEKYNGYMDCFAKNLKILEIRYDTTDFPTNPFRKYIKTNISILLHYFNDTVFLSNMTSSYNFKKAYHVNTIKIISQKFSEFKMTSDEYWGANAISRNPYIFCSPNEWQRLKIENDSKIEIIKRDLAPNTTLEIQYLNNSGKWFYPSNNSSSYKNQFLKKMKQVEDKFYLNK